MHIEPAWMVVALVAAAALGWASARRGRRKPQKRHRRFSREYFRGLNFLLNEEPDKAVEVFTRMVEVDSDTVETHFALGSLFRRRGEVDRAIRVHQNLIARPNLDRDHRAQALFELGLDYMRAGLFDRAETLFQDLAAHRTHGADALYQLLAIYEQQKDWEQAIATARRLESATGISRHEEIAQYHCEMAARAIDREDYRQAAKALRRAQGSDRNAVRVRLLRGRLAELEKRPGEAVQAYERALLIDPAFAQEALPAIARCARHAGQPEILDKIIEDLQRRDTDAVAYIAVAAILDPAVNVPAAQACVERFLQRSESLQQLEELARLLGEGSEIGGAQERLIRALRQMLSQGPRYRCRECGFTGKQLYWQCPSCKTWNSTRPHFELSLDSLINPPHTLPPQFYSPPSNR